MTSRMRCPGLPAFAVTILGSILIVGCQNGADEEPFVFNYRSYLEYLQEPDLEDSCSQEVASVRLVANPAFSSAWSVRLRADATRENVFISESRITEPPIRRSWVGDDSFWLEAQALLTDSDFWNLPRNHETWIPDGTIATVETCVDGRYYAVQRQFWHDDTKAIVDYLAAIRDEE